MTRILEQLKQAEAQRQRIIAERRQLEDEANAALAAREKEELAARARRVEVVEGAARPVRKDRRALAGAAVAIVVALIAAFWPTAFPPEKEPAKTPAPASVAEPVAAATSSNGFVLLKLDQDVEAFAARVREKERQ